MQHDETIELGREAFIRQSWAAAYAALEEAGREGSLDPEDLELAAQAAYLVGQDAASTDLWAQAHHSYLAGGDAERAAACAFWLAIVLMHTGEHAQSGGWIARARRIADEHGLEGVVQGYLLTPLALRYMGSGDVEAALQAFEKAIEIGDRFRDRTLVSFARHGKGRALIRLGRIPEGVALLDEAMVAVTSGELSPMVAGDVYCSVIEACHEIYDLRRAQEWTHALGRWCESQPDLVPYRGLCLIRRAEILLLRGAWSDAMNEATRARESLSRPPPKPAVGAAFYQQAELLRLRGAFDEAEEAYREASRWGQRTQPGLARLRLAQGHVNAANAAIQRALGEATTRRDRSSLLPAVVEIMLAAGDVSAARVACDELSEVAAALGSPYLTSISAQAEGAVLLAEGDPHAALASLRRASAWWQENNAPYESACVGVLVGCACRAIGDVDTGAVELHAARTAFESLGAVPDVRRVDALINARETEESGVLTRREGEVLRLLATGMTNRAIADELFISEKTVARHVSNIFSKLEVSSRAAATAYAYQNEMV